MSKRNDYDYFDLNNFDDSYDSRDYRRRQPQRRQGSYNRRPAYNVGMARRRNKRRIRNRVMIVSGFVLILIFIVLLLSVMFKGCSGGSSSENPNNISTDTKDKQEASIQPTTVANDESFEKLGDLSPEYFKSPVIKDDNTSGEMVYGVYSWNKVGYEIFGSNSAKAEKYAQTINGFADKLEGIKVYDLIIPNHTEMGLPQRLKDATGCSSQAENIKSIYANLSDKVTAINCYNYLADHNKEYIYFHSDHHWTGLGAYYAYSAFANRTEQNVLQLSECTENVVEGFTGTFTKNISNLDIDSVHYWKFPYDVTMDVTDQNGTVNTYYSPYYEYATAGDYTYAVFLVGDNPLSVLKSSSQNAKEGSKIAIVKESYGNALAPYFTNNYEEVHVIDFRHFDGNLVTYCQENGIDEVLFANGVMSANTQIQLDSMSTLFD